MLYIATANTHPDDYGATIYLIGIFSNKKKAEEAAVRFPHPKITEVALDHEYLPDDEVYLGGYAE